MPRVSLGHCDLEDPKWLEIPPSHPENQGDLTSQPRPVEGAPVPAHRAKGLWRGEYGRM